MSKACRVFWLPALHAPAPQPPLVLQPSQGSDPMTAVRDELQPASLSSNPDILVGGGEGSGERSAVSELIPCPSSQGALHQPSKAFPLEQGKSSLVPGQQSSPCIPLGGLRHPRIWEPRNVSPLQSPSPHRYSSQTKPGSVLQFSTPFEDKCFLPMTKSFCTVFCTKG